MIDIHSLEVLEFPRVKELAAAGAGSPRGAAWVRDLAPTLDATEAHARLDLTDELRRLILSAEGFPRIDAPDVRDTLERLEAAGIVLEPADLRGLAAVAAHARLVRERLVPRHDAALVAADFPHAVARAVTLVPCPELERAVAETFGAHDDILDSASGTLRQLRRQARQQRERILQRLEASTRGDDERRVTLRGDRYVVAVRAGDRNALGGGIVHDRSGTGATLYLEPLGVVDENNRLVELLVEEREEIRRILAALSDLARQRRHELGAAADTLAVLDGHRALATLAEKQRAVRPKISADARLILAGFRHPLLLADATRQVEPLDLALGDPPAEGDGADGPVAAAGDGSASDAAAAYRARAAAQRAALAPAPHPTPRARVLLLTGPNMGGKTVALKGVGLACVMAASGFHLPAGPGTEVPLLNGLVADIGDEQSIQNDLSTFASHLRRWIEAVESAGPRTLALLDEIGAGTDPSEGAALAQAVLERLADAGGLAFVTTHLGALKRFASHHPGLMNGSMLFDPASERPLYRLEAGLPGQSRALEMARRLGLPAPLIERAGELVGTEEKEIQALLGQLEAARMQAEGERRAAADAVAAASAEREAYAERVRRLDTLAEGLRLRAARDAQRILTKAEAEVRDAQRALEEAARKSSAEAAAARRELASTRQTVARAQAAAAEAAGLAKPAPGRPAEALDMAPGARLWSVPLSSWVTVVGVPEGGKVRVERNGIRVELPVSALRAAPNESAAAGGTSGAAAPAAGQASRPGAVRPGSGGRRPPEDDLPPDDPGPRKGSIVYAVPEGIRGEVDLRGLLADEALDKLEAFIDGASLAGLSEVRIIHGKGTGALRTAVTRWLTGRAGIASHRLGEAWEGSTGVTVARLE